MGYVSLVCSFSFMWFPSVLDLLLTLLLVKKMLLHSQALCWKKSVSLAYSIARCHHSYHMLAVHFFPFYTEDL